MVLRAYRKMENPMEIFEFLQSNVFFFFFFMLLYVISFDRINNFLFKTWHFSQSCFYRIFFFYITSKIFLTTCRIIFFFNELLIFLYSIYFSKSNFVHNHIWNVIAFKLVYIYFKWSCNSDESNRTIFFSFDTEK